MLEHEHFGKLRSHRHTSYAGLFFVLLVVGVMLLGVSLSALAAPPAENPQSGSVGLTGRVKGPAPSTAAVILSPHSGSRTSSIPITVSGTCPPGTLVSITKNNAFAGVAQCQDDGTFSLLIDLFDGANTLVAKVSDALGQFGPDSAPVEVFYDAPSLSLAPGTIGRQLFLQTTQTVIAGNPSQQLTRTVTIVGGVGPYAVSWDYGDGESSLASQASEGPVSSSHAYARPGIYRVIVRVTDSAGNSAFMQLVTVVNGPVEPVGASKGNEVPGVLISAWPLYILAVIMVLVFWLGEVREARKLRRKGLIRSA